MDTTPTIIAVKFKGGDKNYDFFATNPVLVGQRVFVPTSRGGETKAEVVDIKQGSDKAQAAALRLVEDLRTDQERAARHPNGQRMFAEDRTMLDANGNRSIFDDVDQQEPAR
jgi:hypothetical protein